MKLQKNIKKKKIILQQIDMLEIPDAFKPLISDYKFNLIELRKSEYLKFHNDDVNTIFNISRFIFDEKYDKITDIYKEKNISSELAMVIGCITESQKLINDAIKSEQKGGTVNMCKALEELDLDADFAKPLYDFVLKHIDLSETDIIQKYLEM